MFLLSRANLGLQLDPNLLYENMHTLLERAIKIW